MKALLSSHVDLEKALSSPKFALLSLPPPREEAGDESRLNPHEAQRKQQERQALRIAGASLTPMGQRCLSYLHARLVEAHHRGIAEGETQEYAAMKENEFSQRLLRDAQGSEETLTCSIIHAALDASTRPFPPDVALLCDLFSSRLVVDLELHRPACELLSHRFAESKGVDRDGHPIEAPPSPNPCPRVASHPCVVSD